MQFRRSLRPVAAVAISALVLGLAACTSSDGGGSTGGDDESGAISMVVARGSVNIENSVLADEQGFFTDEGLDIGELQLTGVGGGAATNSAVIAGEFDVAATDAVTAIRAISEGMPIQVVAGTKSADPDYDGEISDGLVVPPGSEITGWEDLAGKKIGVPELGGLPHLTTLTGLMENGVDLDTVEFVALPVDALVEAAATGQVDAVFTFSIFFLTAVDNGFTRIGDGVREYLPHAPQVVWIASTEYTEQNGDALSRFHAALERGTEYGNENVDAVRQAYHDHTELPAAFIDNVMILEPLNVEFDKAGWDKLLDAMKAEGDLRDDLTFEDIVWEGAR